MKYYLLGIKGSGMGTLANLLHDLGNEVSGYDDARGYKFTEEGLRKRNIKIYYEPHNLEEGTIVSYSKAMGEDHKELLRVKELGFEIKEYRDVIGDLTKQFNTVGVCGTHGKTTTSLLISNIINNTLGCNYFVGDGSGYGDKKNDIFVIESDEYNKHFLSYFPNIAVMTNIELDHVECYDGLEDIINCFKKFGEKSDLVIACGDDENIRSIKFSKDKEVIYYGFNENNNVVAKNVELSKDGSNFDVYIDGEFYEHFKLPLYGRHMILNSLAAIIVSRRFNIDKEDIKKYISNFVSPKRRFKETKINDAVIIDDYAHHPTEIKVTLESAKQKYPDKEIVAVFLPNTYSRTEALLDDFVKELSKADKAYIMDILCDREKQEDYPGISSDLIIDKVKKAEKISNDTAEKLLKHKSSVICFMSCGYISPLIDKTKELFSQLK